MAVDRIPAFPPTAKAPSKSAPPPCAQFDVLYKPSINTFGVGLPGKHRHAVNRNWHLISIKKRAIKARLKIN